MPLANPLARRILDVTHGLAIAVMLPHVVRIMPSRSPDCTATWPVTPDCVPPTIRVQAKFWQRI